MRLLRRSTFDLFHGAASHLDVPRLFAQIAKPEIERTGAVEGS